jgi:hypothetical protein
MHERWPSNINALTEPAPRSAVQTHCLADEDGAPFINTECQIIILRHSRVRNSSDPKFLWAGSEQFTYLPFIAIAVEIPSRFDVGNADR